MRVFLFLGVKLHPRAVELKRITAEQSVRTMRKVFDTAGPKDSGKFFDYTGKEYPW